MTQTLSRPKCSTKPQGWLVRNPEYVDLLDSFGLDEGSAFFSLPEEIVSGHPDRHVARVTIGAVSAYLKREHVVPWKERFTNWRAGFGWASKSWREAQTLALLDQTAIGHPDWIAAGEDGSGRAFVLLRELPGALPLTACLRRGVDCAATVGRAIAALHQAGFDHPDLYAGHVYLDVAGNNVAFLDWQRARRLGIVSDEIRGRGLAALLATLPDSLANTDWRAACLAHYTRSSPGVTLAALTPLVEKLRQRRHIRSKLACEPSPETSLFLLDEGRLWLTRAGRAQWPDAVPVEDWLHGPAALKTTFADGKTLLMTRGCHRPLLWQRGPWTSPERRRMGLLFRLERLGIAAPRVLAVGEYPQPDGTVAAFLVTSLPADCGPLPDVCPDTDRLLRQLDDAGFVLPGGKKSLAWHDARPVVFDVADLSLRPRGWFARLCSPRRVASL